MLHHWIKQFIVWLFPQFKQVSLELHAISTELEIIKSILTQLEARVEIPQALKIQPKLCTHCLEPVTRYRLDVDGTATCYECIKGV